MYFPLTWSNKAKCEGDFEAAHRRIQARISQEPYRCAREKIHWIMLCQMVENTSDAILQRQHRLQGIQSKEKHDDKGDERSKKLSDEIAFLGYTYRINQEFIHILELNAPAYAPNAEERVLLRQHRDRHGRTFAWLHDRGQCADSGGCCGRSCGCCEKPLRKYTRPTNDPDGGKEEIEVLGHCTSECICCIRFQGFYRRHENLPGTAFRVSGVLNLKNPAPSILFKLPSERKVVPGH